MKKLTWLVAVILIITNCSQKENSDSAITPEELEQAFAAPPASARPHTWWHWMSGNITKEGITADLEAMADAGLGGAQIFNVSENIPHGPIQFNSPEWIDMVKHAASEAKRLGLELCIHNCAGWANSGGPWNTPEHGMKMVVTGEMQVKGGTSVTAPPPQPEASPDFYRDIAVLAFPTPAANPAAKVVTDLNSRTVTSLKREETTTEMSPETVIQQDRVIDLTDQLFPSPDGKTTAWNAPEGDWTVLRVGYTINGRKNHPAPDEGRGLECDKLSREAVKAHWDGHAGLILAALGKMDGPDKPGLNNILIDSYEVGSQNWTQGFEKEFQARCGYSILKFLPVFTGRIVDSPEMTERFLWDFRRVIADLFAENYSEYFGKLAHSAGLLYSCEPYGNSPSDDIQYGSFCDIPMGEFWPGSGHSVNSGNAKLPAAIAHVYGRKFVGAEAFTAAPEGGKWKKGPFDIKAQGDAVYCGGVNRMIYHRYAHQPWTDPTRYPGMTMGQWGTHFERTLTWWEQGREWLRYQARCQYMLQEGRFVADVLFYCGEGAPNELRDAKLPYGYDYDGCDTRALKMLKVKDGRLVLPSGMSYRMLVLPDDPVMSPEILKTVGQLIDGGAVVVGKNRPEHAPGLRNYPAGDAKVKQLADKIWPKVISGKSPADVLESLGIKPDFSAGNEEHINYIHREINGMDCYFIACSNQKGEDVKCTFRISGRAPEFWHPDTGETEAVPVYEEKDGLTTIPVRFEPSGSVFVVFRKPVSAEDHAVEVKYTAAEKKPARTGDLKIVKAEYGYFADEGVENCANVTELVRKQVAGGKSEITASNDRLNGDPAPGVFKQLQIDYRVNGTDKQMRITENQSAELPQGAEIIKAWYGIIGNIPKTEPVRKTVDVTAKLAGQVKDGALTVAVNSELAGGKDPAASPKKEVRAEYLYDGIRGWAKAGENQTLLLPPEPEDAIPLPAYELYTAGNGNVEIRAWETGSFEVAMASGKTRKTGPVNVPDRMEIDGPWQLSFPPNWGAPPQITLDKLTSWTEHADAGVKYFSGTATYGKTFTWNVNPASDTRVILDLGRFKNFAEVRLNGKSFPVLWKPPYFLDITEAVQTGENTLQIAITNLWPNRLIGDEQLPDDREWEGLHLKEWPQWVLDGQPSPTGRFTFTTWHHWKKDDALLPSGLFGPVQVRQVKCVEAR
ncbi:MAG: hypothetical protein LBL07_12405 [Tannerella sp.]|jgi:hypothetical protein|nr:hypothetical protein [Tannerella sp.]